MSEQLHLQPRYRSLVESLLQAHLPDAEVWAYGSRVSGRNHDGRDLDLVVRGPGLRQIEPALISAFVEAIRESNIPILVDARDWACMPSLFHREIERRYVVVQAGRT